MPQRSWGVSQPTLGGLVGGVSQRLKKRRAGLMRPARCFFRAFEGRLSPLAHQRTFADEWKERVQTACCAHALVTLWESGKSITCLCVCREHHGAALHLEHRRFIKTPTITRTLRASCAGLRENPAQWHCAASATTAASPRTCTARHAPCIEENQSPGGD